MTFEEIQKLLNDYKAVKRQLDSEQLRIAELRNQLTSLRVTDYSKDRICNGGQNSYIDRILDRIGMIELRCIKLMDQVFAAEDIISSNMDYLTPTEQAMIIDRYMHGWSWAKICRKYCYCERQAIRVVQNSIKKMVKK